MNEMNEKSEKVENKVQIVNANPSNLLTMDPVDLFTWVNQNFQYKIPVSLETEKGMQMAGQLLGKCTADYAYLSAMTIRAKLEKRRLKQAGADKTKIDDAMSREDIFSMQADIAKTTYNAVSRMITVKQLTNDELRFTDGKR